MKTNLFIAALSLVVLAGCSSEDEIDTLVSKSDNAITFGTYVGKQTKALDKSAFAKDDKFGVSAYYGDGTLVQQMAPLGPIPTRNIGQKVTLFHL